jgi:hypothetical protein
MAGKPGNRETEMTQETPTNDKQAVREWYVRQLDAVVKEMIKSGVVSGVAIEAAPVWALPFKILIAKVWNANEKSRFIWTISGERVTTDHIDGKTAQAPRDVARHFALKWQVDAERLGNFSGQGAPAQDSRTHMKDYAGRLVENAEYLYELSTRDDIWKNKIH